MSCALTGGDVVVDQARGIDIEKYRVGQQRLEEQGPVAVLADSPGDELVGVVAPEVVVGVVGAGLECLRAEQALHLLLGGRPGGEVAVVDVAVGLVSLEGHAEHPAVAGRDVVGERLVDVVVDGMDRAASMSVQSLSV